VSEVFVYTVQRLALFVVCLLVFAWLGAGPVLAVVLAALASMGLSYVLLRRQREAVAARVAERVERRALRGPGPADADTAAEDAAAEDAAAEDAAAERSGAQSSAAESSAADKHD
jgi:hypothetical protein